MGNIQNRHNGTFDYYSDSPSANLLCFEKEHVNRIHSMYEMFMKNPLKHCIGSQKNVYTTNENFQQTLNLGLCKSNIKSQNSFKIQAVANVMNQLAVLNAIHDPRAMHVALTKIISTHMNITEADFTNYRDHFIKYLVTTFPEKMTESMQISCYKFFTNYGKAIIHHRQLLESLGHMVDDDFANEERKLLSSNIPNGIEAVPFYSNTDELVLSEINGEELNEEYETYNMYKYL